MSRAGLALLLSLCACSSVSPQRRISFATVQSLGPGVDGRWVLEEFPNTRGVDRDAQGRIRRLEYGVDDPQGKGQSLVLHFDENEVLTRKEYSGRLVRPLDPDADAARGPTGAPRPRR